MLLKKAFLGVVVYDFNVLEMRYRVYGPFARRRVFRIEYNAHIHKIDRGGNTVYFVQILFKLSRAIGTAQICYFKLFPEHAIVGRLFGDGMLLFYDLNALEMVTAVNNPFKHVAIAVYYHLLRHKINRNALHAAYFFDFFFKLSRAVGAVKPADFNFFIHCSLNAPLQAPPSSLYARPIRNTEPSSPRGGT